VIACAEINGQTGELLQKSKTRCHAAMFDLQWDLHWDLIHNWLTSPEDIASSPSLAQPVPNF